MNFAQMKELKRNADAYLKHSYTIEDINQMIDSLNASGELRLSIQVDSKCLGLTSEEADAVRDLLIVAKEHLEVKLDAIDQEVEGIFDDAQESYKL